MHVTNYDTALSCNRLVYCYKRNEYFIYQINEINGQNLICNKIGQYPVQFPETPNIPWSKVGVFRKGGISSNNVTVPMSDIKGKVVSVDKYLITAPKNVLDKK